jgi:hypothetical protein
MKNFQRMDSLHQNYRQRLAVFFLSIQFKSKPVEEIFFLFPVSTQVESMLHSRRHWLLKSLCFSIPRSKKYKSCFVAHVDLSEQRELH